MARAIELGRVVLTNNRRDYHRLHRTQPAHTGIVTFTNDPDRSALARRIHTAVAGHPDLAGLLIRVICPNPLPKAP